MTQAANIMAGSAARPARPALGTPEPARPTIQYAPTDGAEANENPPRFTWLPVIEDEARYALRLSRDPAFPDGATLLYADLPLNFLTPPDVLEPGTWHWQYAVWDDGAPASGWSAARSVEVAEGLPETPLASRADRWSSVDLAHPRLWLSPARLASLRGAVADDPDHCA